MRTTKFLTILALLLMAVTQGARAVDGIYCTASDVGRVVCTDGSIYDNVAAATAAGGTAVAKIIWIDQENKKGLALALQNESGGAMYQQAAIDKCNEKNTTQPVNGATWKLATQGEWNTMIGAAGGRDALCDGFSSVGGTNMPNYSPNDSRYWSSSEGNWYYDFYYKYN